MTKIARKNHIIFCGNVTPTGNIAQYGSLKAATPAYSGDPEIISSLSAWGFGWSQAVVSNQAPALQDVNAVEYVHSYQIGYLLQQGIAEWNTTTVYYIGSLVSDSTGAIFKSLTDNNTGNALTDVTKWICYYSDKIATASSNYTVATDIGYVRATGAAAITITLPQAVSDNAGRKIRVKSALTANALLTLSCTGGSLIDGVASIILVKNSCLEVISNGSSWDIV